MGDRSFDIARLPQFPFSHDTLVVVILASLFPIFLSWPAFAQSGYPFGGEIFSNLLPALHARFDIANGQLPLRTELFFDGRYQFNNPLWYGFYPPAWLLFVPFVPLDIAVKVVVAVHLMAVPAVAYFHARKLHSWYVAALLAVLWVLPLASQVAGAHLEKIFAWPWFVLAAWQLSPRKLRADRRRTGIAIGFAAGMILLAGGNYYFAYLGLLVAPLVLLYRSRSIVRGGIVGGLVGLPHLLSVLPTLLAGPSRPEPGYGVWPHELVQLLTGSFVVPGLHPPSGVTNTGYAVVGIGAVLVATYGWYQAFYRNRLWATGLTVSGLVAALLSGEVLYILPGVDALRIASRANIVLAAIVLLLTSYGFRTAIDVELDWNVSLHRTLTVLLVVSVVHAGAAWTTTYEYGAVEPDYENVAQTLIENNVDSVWIASNPAWTTATDRRLNSPQLGFVLTKHRIGLRAVHYGYIGQDWTVRENGCVTFDALLTANPIPYTERIRLTTADRNSSTKGTIQTSNLHLLRVVETESGPVWIYMVRDEN